MKWLKYLLLFISLSGTFAHAQQLFFTSYTIEKGLSQSVVNCVFQDSQGFLWVGTQNGLNRFDGYEFRVFTHDPSDSNSISNSWIFAVDEDRNGNLWIATKGGLNQYRPKENRFVRLRFSSGYLHAVEDYPYDTRVSKDGNILINTPPVLTIYNPKTHRFRHHTSILTYDGSVKDNRIPLLEDREGFFWIGSTTGLARFDPKTGKFSYFNYHPGDPGSISDNNITALYEDVSGALWIGTPSGLNRFNRFSGTFDKFNGNPGNRQFPASGFIRAITADSYGNLWIGTEGGGLHRAKPSENGSLVMDHFISENNGPAHNIVLSLIIDRSGNLWAGTLQGLSKTDLKPLKFKLYRRDDTSWSTDLLGNVIASIYKDDKGIVWVGNWGQGLNRINRKTGQVDHFSTRLAGNRHITNDFVHVIYADLWNNIWIGTRDGIAVFDRIKNQFIPFREFFRNTALPNFSGVRIYSIVRSRDNIHWIGTQNGLYRINLTTGASDVFNDEALGNHHLSGNLIYSLLEDRDGLIWIATLNGLDVFNPKSGQMKHYRTSEGQNSLCDNFVISLCEDHRGDIWIGTGSYVNRFDKKSGTFQYYSQQNGLPNNRIFEILEDDHKTLWFATGGGLCRFDTLTEKFKIYTVEEGLQSSEFNLRACCKSSDGEIFFGGMNGFNSFYPDSIRDNSNLPVMVFTAFYKTNTAGQKTFLEVSDGARISLNHNDHTFTIEFAALEFTNPEKNRYAYMLEGVSDQWTETGTRHFVPFFNLPPGEYTFRVKGSNNDGHFNEKPISLHIIIHPPWWRTTWAWAGYLILAAGLIMVFIRIRERNLIRERDLLEEKVQQRTRKIEALNATRDKFFSIIAHDLRNPFNTILGLSEIALGNLQHPESEKGRKSVADIRDTAKHTFDLLQNLLWWARSQTGALDFQPGSFNISELIHENIDLLKSQAEKKNIVLKCQCSDEVMVTADTRMIDTVLRNLLSNAIKFTQQGGQIVIAVVSHDRQVEVSVADNGIGISAENIPRIFKLDNKYSRKGTDKERGSGLGLILCQEFIEKHGGVITVESEPGKGSTFRFSLPS